MTSSFTFEQKAAAFAQIKLGQSLVVGDLTIVDQGTWYTSVKSWWMANDDGKLVQLVSDFVSEARGKLMAPELKNVPLVVAVDTATTKTEDTKVVAMPIKTVCEIICSCILGLTNLRDTYSGATESKGLASVEVKANPVADALTLSIKQLIELVVATQKN